MRATISLENEILVNEYSGGACSFNAVYHNKRAFKKPLPGEIFLPVLEFEC